MSRQEMNFFSEQAVRSKRVIYTASEFATHSLLYLQETGSLTALKPHSSHRQGLASYLFFLVREGEGTLEYGGKQYQLFPGDCVFIDCQQAYSHNSSPDQLWSLEWVHFYGESMEQIYEKYGQRGGKPVFHPGSPDHYHSRLQMIYSIADSWDHIRDMRLNEQLSSLLVYLMEETWSPDTTSATKQSELHLIKDYIEAHYEERLSLESLAEQFYINKYYLSKIFKEGYGITVNGYIMQVRITQAKQLLRFTDLDIETIGNHCGVPDPNYFTRAFKKVEGMTPSQYRKTW